ncbi:MAG: ANTAR domain-containing protein [Phycicoccus sp.]|nr:ANTAR domain-containing protein [Phycicoccus sp.]NMM34535.1 ANTAR domain-containing protein [Phycicoccus sp.]
MEVHALDRTRREREDRIGRELSIQFSGAQILRRAVMGAVESVEGCDYAGVSLRSHHGEVQTPAWTSPAVWMADAMQVTLGDGPSLEPMWIGDYVTVDDLSTNRRWGQWAPSVVTLGLRSLISVRLPGGSQTFAALNLYSARARGFGLTSLDEACSYAVEVLDAIQAAGRGTGFETAMATQSLVSMAQGVMRYRYGVEVSRALSLLQTYSVKSHVKFQDAAREFVNAGRCAR